MSKVVAQYWGAQGDEATALFAIWDADVVLFTNIGHTIPHTSIHFQSNQTMYD